jgi:hypothetical protein
MVEKLVGGPFILLKTFILSGGMLPGLIVLILSIEYGRLGGGAPTKLPGGEAPRGRVCIAGFSGPVAKVGIG